MLKLYVKFLFFPSSSHLEVFVVSAATLSIVFFTDFIDYKLNLALELQFKTGREISGFAPSYPEKYL